MINNKYSRGFCYVNLMYLLNRFGLHSARFHDEPRTGFNKLCCHHEGHYNHDKYIALGNILYKLDLESPRARALYKSYQRYLESGWAQHQRYDDQ